MMYKNVCACIMVDSGYWGADSCYWQIFSHIVTMGKERPDSYNELTVETPTHG